MPKDASSGPSRPFQADSIALLAAIVASSNDAIIGKDLSGTVTSWNEAAEHLFGHTAKEMIGRSITRIIPPERVQEEASILARIGRGERISHFETRRITKDGRTIPVSLTISPVLDRSGAVVGVSKIVRDLSGLHDLNQELERRRALLSAILDTIPDGLIVINESAAIQSFSHTAERMFGYRSAEVLGQNVRLLMPPDNATAHDGYMRRYLTTGERRIIGIGRVVLGRRKDGTTFPMALHIGEVLVSGSHLFAGFVRDLTERQARDRRLTELQSELIHVSRLSELGQMVSALSHEVNQPLTAIANYARGLRHMLGLETPQPLRSAVDKIAEQTDRAIGIVQSLRSLSKKESRLRSSEALETLVRETAALVLVGREHAIKLVLEIAPSATHAFVDKVQIQQVLFNLMRNAAEAMAESPVRTLRLATIPVDDRVEISLSDTGPGLPDTVEARLFEPFFTTKADGLGVGLSICRTIIHAHGGDLTVESKPGQGTRFRFTVPASDPPKKLFQ